MGLVNPTSVQGQDITYQSLSIKRSSLLNVSEIELGFCMLDSKTLKSSGLSKTFVYIFETFNQTES